MEKTIEIRDYNGSIIENPDLEKGYLEPREEIIIVEEEQEATEGKFHLELIKEYPNGGKEFKKVWDEIPKPYKEAVKNVKKYFEYISYSDEQLEKIKQEKEELEKNSLDKQIDNIQVALAEVYELVVGGTK